MSTMMILPEDNVDGHDFSSALHHFKIWWWLLQFSADFSTGMDRLDRIRTSVRWHSGHSFVSNSLADRKLQLLESNFTLFWHSQLLL